MILRKYPIWFCLECQNLTPHDEWGEVKECQPCRTRWIAGVPNLEIIPRWEAFTTLAERRALRGPLKKGLIERIVGHRVGPTMTEFDGDPLVMARRILEDNGPDPGRADPELRAELFFHNRRATAGRLR